jgi:hypothetical protein
MPLASSDEYLVTVVITIVTTIYHFRSKQYPLGAAINELETRMDKLSQKRFLRRTRKLGARVEMAILKKDYDLLVDLRDQLTRSQESKFNLWLWIWMNENNVQLRLPWGEKDWNSRRRRVLSESLRRSPKTLAQTALA